MEVEVKFKGDLYEDSVGLCRLTRSLDTALNMYKAKESLLNLIKVYDLPDNVLEDLYDVVELLNTDDILD